MSRDERPLAVHAAAMTGSTEEPTAAPRALRQELGAAFERAAERHLTAAGLVVVARNFRCKAGELDLVCLEGEVLVIVEVRLRRRNDFGGALASVTAAKQRRLRRATLYFLLREPRWRGHRLRFDVVAARSVGAGAPAPLWVRDAFRP